MFAQPSESSPRRSPSEPRARRARRRSDQKLAAITAHRNVQVELYWKRTAILLSVKLQRDLVSR
jgi:hypothetical protein